MPSTPEPEGGWTSLPLPAMFLDADGRVLSINHEAEAFFNLSLHSMAGRSLDDLVLRQKLRFSPDIGLIIAEKLRLNSRLVIPIDIAVADLGGRLVRHSAVLHATIANDQGRISAVFVPDPEIRLGRSAGKTSPATIGMGQMLAHEIKNPLAAIRGAAQLIAMDLAPEQTGPLQMTELIGQECAQVVALLAQVERFGDPAPPRMRAFNLHDVTEHARKSAALGIASGLEIVTDYDPSLPEAEGDAPQILQVIVNLLANSAEAITRSGTGNTIRIKTFYDASVRLDGRALPLQIRIEDDGPGLPPALAKRIFEPFVSGRENGTGLGLALAAKIIAGHGAIIRSENKPACTAFRVSLAIADQGVR